MGCSGSIEAGSSKKKKGTKKGKKNGEKTAASAKKRKSASQGSQWRSRPEGREEVKMDFTNIGTPEHPAPTSRGRKKSHRGSTFTGGSSSQFAASKRSVGGETLPPPNGSEVEQQSSSRDNKSSRYGTTGSEFNGTGATGATTVDESSSQYMSSSHHGAGETLQPEQVATALNPLQSPPQRSSQQVQGSSNIGHGEQRSGSKRQNTAGGVGGSPTSGGPSTFSNFPNPVPDLESQPSRSGSSVSSTQASRAKRLKEVQEQLITLQKQEVTARVTLQASLLALLSEIKPPPLPVSDNSTMPHKAKIGVSNKTLKGEEYNPSIASQSLGPSSSLLNDEAAASNPTTNFMTDAQRQKELEKLLGGDSDDSFEDDGPRRCSMQTKESDNASQVGLSFKPKESEEDLRIKKLASSGNASNPYSRANVRRHSHESDLWVIIRNTVYNLTEFHDLHPGGTWPLLQVAGKDATKSFEDQHGAGYAHRLQQYVVGKVPAEERW